MTERSIFPVGAPEYDALYAQEAAMVDAAELIAGALEASGMSRADLARALNISRAEVTARLKGERNITVRKLAETLHAMGETLTLGSERIALDRGRRRARTWQLKVAAPETARRSGPWVQQEENLHAR